MRSRPEMKFYAIRRQDGVAIMQARASHDAEAEALKGGDVLEVLELTPAQASELKAARPKPEARKAKAQAEDFITREEMDARIREEIAKFGAEIIRTPGG